MKSADWSAELGWIEAAGHKLTPGLSNTELSEAERVHGFVFPPDLRSFLSTAMPTGDSFPNWRQLEEQPLIEWMDWPATGMAFDIEHNRYWHAEWGKRPDDLSDAVEVMRAKLKMVPILIPVYAHRYLPCEPAEVGNPIFSVYQTDIIYYGSNLSSFFACEMGGISHAEIMNGEFKRIRFWSEFC